MAQFNADILLAVRGSEKAKREIEKLEASINKIGKRANLDISGQIRLKGAQSLLREEVRITAEYNKQLKVSQQIAREANQLARVRGNANQYSGPIGPGQASPSRLSSSLAIRRNQEIQQRSRGLNQFPLGVPAPEQDPVRDQQRRAKIIERNIALRNREKAIARATAKIDASRTARLAGQNSLTNGLLRLNKATLEAARSEAQERGESVAKQRELNNELKKTEAFSKSVYGNKPIGPKQAPGSRGGARRGGGAGASALSNAAIGASFPLLFGQSGTAALGGALGGGLGSFLGPTGGFAGSLVGTVVGDLINAQAEIQKLAREMGVGKEATDLIATSFKQAGQNAEQLAAAIQGVRGIGLDIDSQVEAIRLSSKLSKEYGGQVEKIVSSFNKVATSGKVAFSDLARFAGQGVPLLSTLEKNLGVTRSQLLQLAKDGKISAQQVVDALVQIGNASEGNALKTEGRWEKAWRLISEGAATSVQAIGIVLGVLTGDVNKTAGDIAVSFAELYKNLVLGAVNAASKIAEAFAGVAKGISEYADIFSLGGLNPVATKIGGNFGELAERLDKASKSLKELGKNANTAFKPIKNIKIPGLLDGNGNGGGNGGALPQSKELQLRQQILEAELAVANIQGQRAALQLTDLEAVRAKEQLLAASLVKETRILELARQQALASSKVPEDDALINQLYDDRLKKIQAQNFLLREKNGLTEKDILLQRDLVALRNEQQTEGIVQGLERSIEDANSRSSSEMLSLRIKQLRRQEDLIGGINDKLAEQRLIEAGSDAKKAAAATREINFLEDRKAKLAALLPVLNQAEQQQLRFNQAFAAITPAVNSLVGGLREVVAGTKTAEQAFADFLNTIADQLINTAATMIAQYIAIGIARQFAGLGGNPGGGAGGFNLSGGGSSVGSGGLPGIDSLGGLFNGSLPFIGVDALATGGTANGGQPYIVGERGPELFIPGVTGTVTNNDQFEAARNALSDGSTGDAFDENGEALSNSSTNSSSQDSSTSNYYSQNGAALAAISRSFSENNNSLATSSSYMRESAMERESQTTVSSGGSMVIETQVINSTEYATVEQVRLASAASAKQARAQVFSDMKNKPSRRAMVGLR